MTKLYNPSKTYIFIGESNVGKTTTLNSILSSCLQKKINFFTKNELNATKITTIVHLNQDLNNKFKLLIKSISSNNIYFNNEYDTFEELISAYNNASEKESKYYDNFAYIYIPNNNTSQEENIILIDVIGKTLDYPDYDKYINKIKNIYPNNICINVIKDLNLYTFDANCINLVSHADKINYNDDKTMMVKHKCFIPYIKSKLFFISNVIIESLNLELDDNNIEIFHKNNMYNIFNFLLDKFTYKISDITDINSFKLSPNKSYDDLKNYIKSYNNIEIYNQFKLLASQYSIKEKNIVIESLKKDNKHIETKLNCRQFGEGIMYCKKEILHLVDNYNEPYKKIILDNFKLQLSDIKHIIQLSVALDRIFKNCIKQIQILYNNNLNLIESNLKLTLYKLLEQNQNKTINRITENDRNLINEINIIEPVSNKRRLGA